MVVLHIANLFGILCRCGNLRTECAIETSRQEALREQTWSMAASLAAALQRRRNRVPSPLHKTAENEVFNGIGSGENPLRLFGVSRSAQRTFRACCRLRRLLPVIAVVTVVMVVVMMVVMMVMPPPEPEEDLGGLHFTGLLRGGARIIRLQQIRGVGHRIEKVPIACRAGRVICCWRHCGLGGSEGRQGGGSAEKACDSLIHMSSKGII
jgi:hypothetical protein